MNSDSNVFRHQTVTQQGTEDYNPQVLRVGAFRDMVERLDDEVPVSIAVRDRHHFNVLLGELPVVGASVMHGADRPVLVLDVVGVT